MKDPLAQFPGYLLRRASAVAFAEISERLTKLSLRPTEASILTLIANNDDATQSDIGGYLGIHRANMVPIVSRLEESGLVCRKPLDGRSQALALTVEGAVVQKKALLLMQAYEDSLVQRVPVESRAHIRPVLNSLWGGRS